MDVVEDQVGTRAPEIGKMSYSHSQDWPGGDITDTVATRNPHTGHCHGLWFWESN
jgi:hypothetical protein